MAPGRRYGLSPSQGNRLHRPIFRRSTSRFPDAGRSTPAAIRNSVVFPTPLVPISAVQLPASSSKLAWRRTDCGPGRRNARRAGGAGSSYGIAPFHFAQQIQEEGSADERHQNPNRHFRRSKDGARQGIRQHQEDSSGQRSDGQQANVIRAQQQPRQRGAQSSRRS